MQILVDSSQLEGLRSRIAALASVDTAPLLEQVGDALEGAARERFQTKTGPDGAPWRPWSPGYARTRRAGHSLLEETGALARSILHFAEGGELVVGSPVAYASVHQDGPRARPFLGLSATEATALEERAAHYLAEAVGA